MLNSFQIQPLAFIPVLAFGALIEACLPENKPTNISYVHAAGYRWTPPVELANTLVGEASHELIPTSDNGFMAYWINERGRIDGRWLVAKDLWGYIEDYYFAPEMSHRHNPIVFPYGKLGDKVLVVFRDYDYSQQKVYASTYSYESHWQDPRTLSKPIDKDSKVEIGEVNANFLDQFNGFVTWIERTNSSKISIYLSAFDGELDRWGNKILVSEESYQNPNEIDYTEPLIILNEDKDIIVAWIRKSPQGSDEIKYCFVTPETGCKEIKLAFTKASGPLQVGPMRGFAQGKKSGLIWSDSEAEEVRLRFLSITPEKSEVPAIIYTGLAGEEIKEIELLKNSEELEIYWILKTENYDSVYTNRFASGAPGTVNSAINDSEKMARISFLNIVPIGPKDRLISWSQLEGQQWQLQLASKKGDLWNKPEKFYFGEIGSSIKSRMAVTSNGSLALVWKNVMGTDKRIFVTQTQIGR